MTEFGNERTPAQLIALGFEQAAVWHLSGEWLDYRFLEGTEDKMIGRCAVSNALYAFCFEDQVLYIGKTSQTLTKRLKGYRKPSSTQSTNQKCHALIKAAICEGRTIELFVFAPPEDLMFRGFMINLAGGLEDILILHFSPPWNGGAKKIKLTESSEHECQQLAQDDFLDDEVDTIPEIGRFTILLTQTYYSKGIINPGHSPSGLLGATDAPLTIRFSDGAPSITTRIDRRANRNSSVRLIGGNQILAGWFQKNFRQGEAITARILGPYLIELMTRPITLASGDPASAED